MEWWAITDRRWDGEPLEDRVAEEWGLTPTEVEYFLREFRRAFPVEVSPTRMMREIRAAEGHVGLEAIRASSNSAVRL
jgi:hypothetical protein